MPKNFEEAVQIAVTVYEAEKQERRNQAFFSHTSYDSESHNVVHPVKRQGSNPVRGGCGSKSRNYGSSRQGSRREMHSYNCGKMGHYARQCPVRKNSFNKNHNNRQGQKPHSSDKVRTKLEGARQNLQSPEN
jgi:hypothetical protein